MGGNRKFEMRELTQEEHQAVSHLVEEALDERIEVYIKTFGAEGAEQFIIENTKTMPMIREMYLIRYRATVNARLGR